MITPKRSLAAALAVLSAFISHNLLAADIGSRYVETPRNDCEIYAEATLEQLPGYGIDIGSCSGRSEAWLSQVLSNQSKNEEGKSSWEVVDHLRLGALTKNIGFDWAYVCFLPKPLGAVQWLPILDYSKKQPLTHQNGGILQAWRVNTVTKRFELVPLDLLKKAKCVEE